MSYPLPELVAAFRRTYDDLCAVIFAIESRPHWKRDDPPLADPKVQETWPRYGLSATKARELSVAASSWLPQLAAKHGYDCLDERKPSTVTMRRLLAFGLSNGPNDVGVPEMREIANSLCERWESLSRLCEWESPSPLPPRLLELAERWSGSRPWKELQASLELNRDDAESHRVSRDERSRLVASGYPSELIRIQEQVVEDARQKCAGSTEQLRRWLGELCELYNLTRTHAPRSLGRIPDPSRFTGGINAVVPTDDDCADYADRVRELYGTLLPELVKPPAAPPFGSTPVPPDPFAALRQYARDNLKGQERAVVEALCDAGGELALANLALKTGVGWDDAGKGFTNTQRRLRDKLKKEGWTLSRHNNAAKLTQSKALKTC